MSPCARAAGAGAIFVALALVARAHWEEPDIVPVERLAPTLEKRVAEVPNDAQAHYLLGRVHSAAFANGCNGVVAWELEPHFLAPPSDKSQTPPDCVGRTVMQRVLLQKSIASYGSPRRFDAGASLGHLELAVDHLSRAVELAPDTALYELGLAFVLDSGAHLSDQVNSVALLHFKVPGHAAELDREIESRIAALGDESDDVRAAAEHRLAEMLDLALPALVARRADSDSVRQAAVARLLAREWRELAIRGYLRAYSLRVEPDAKRSTVNVSGTEFDCRISVEAGASYVRLVGERGVRDDERERVAEVERNLAELAKPENQEQMITPILVPDTSDATLDSLFDSASARFDLAGFGVEQTWPWPRENASFLVWDPECSGQITSGRQLFGSATWWMFFENGYAALDGLDGDGDGWLTGDELEGLALWRDANRNGASEPGEVESLAARGVLAIATRADGVDGISPMRANGVVFADGRRLPSFDWIATPRAPAPNFQLASATRDLP